MQLTRAKLFTLLGNELDKLHIGKEFEFSHGKVVVEINIVDGKVDTVIGYRQSTKSWDLRSELKASGP